MMMSAGEFKRFLNKKSFSKIIFSTIRSSDPSLIALPMSFSMEFDSIYIDQSPPAITVKGASGAICFESVKSINADEDEENNVICVDFICRSCGHNYHFRLFIC